MKIEILFTTLYLLYSYILYNKHCDFLIVRHCSSVMPMGRLRVCKKQSKKSYNKQFINHLRLGLNRKTLKL